MLHHACIEKTLSICIDKPLFMWLVCARFGVFLVVVFLKKNSTHFLLFFVKKDFTKELQGMTKTSRGSYRRVKPTLSSHFCCTRRRKGELVFLGFR